MTRPTPRTARLRPGRVGAFVPAAVLAAALLGGCTGTITPPGDAGAAGSSTSGSSSPVPSGASPSPSPSFACPEVEGQELPAGCVGFDGERSMAQNEAHRQEVPLSATAQTAMAVARDRAARALAPLEGRTDLTVDDVVDALSRAGFDAGQVRAQAVDLGTHVRVPFTVEHPPGCLTGVVDGQRTTLETRGYRADGGCFEGE